MITPTTLESGPCTAWPLSSTLPPLGALATAPGTARGEVRAVLADWQLTGITDVCETVVTELVTNALNASTTPGGGLVYVDGRMPVIRVYVFSDRRQVLIEVHDEAAGAPRLRDVAPATAEAGRGLRMVHELTGGQWGWQPKQGQHGKCVWAALPLHGQPGQRFPFSAVVT